MTSKARSKQELLVEVADLRLRMAEAEDILRAIREYEVDALVVKAGHGDQVFALESADHAYRQMVEQMREGAATLTVDGVVLYANQQLARLMQCPPSRLFAQLRNSMTRNASFRRSKRDSWIWTCSKQQNVETPAALSACWWKAPM